MRLSVRGREEPVVNLTSLIDVVLLLLIFFMVSTSFVKDARINLTLPEASAEAKVAPPADKLEVQITADGKFWVNGRELINAQRDTLEAALLEISAGDVDIPLTLSADADANYQHFVTALDIAGNLGFKSVSIATVELADEIE